MPLKLYNSYTKRKEVFRPRKAGKVAMYNCGPTVYDFVHIGNLRSFLLADVLRRYLEWRNYKVKQVMNITDVGHMTTDADAGEDKMSLAAKREGKGPLEVARFYEEKFMEDMRALGVRQAWKYPRATEHVAEMIKIVKKLLKNGHAYLVRENNAPSPGLRPPSPAGRGTIGDSSPRGRGEGEGHSVYYYLSTFPNYGKLSGNKVEDLLAGARVDVVQEKRNPYDFALWIYKPSHVLQWPAPWGAGYPGWHLECSAMAMKYLGATLDIHTGGEDNKFPHHECEIAQSEGATGKKFVRLWLHAKHLLVDGKKMSKSLGNFFTLRDLIAKGYSAREIRYVLISTHYRETLNFTLESLSAARSALGRIDEVVEKLHGATPSPGLRPPSPSGRGTIGDSSPRGRGEGEGTKRFIVAARRDFIAAMDDDLNVSKALAVLFEFIRKVNASQEYGAGALQLLQEFDAVLGLGIGENKKTVIPTEVVRLAQEREAARQAKNWKRADELREEIKSRGYVVDDTPEGPRLKPV